MEEEVLGKAYDGRLMRRLLTYLRPYKSELLIALVLLSVNAVLQAVGPLLTEFAVDRYLVPSSHPALTQLNRLTASDPWIGLAQVSFAYLAALVAGFLCDFGEQYLMQAIGQRAMFDLRRQLMGHLQRLDLAYYDHNPVGRLVTRLTTDVDALNELFSSGLLMILGDVLMLSIVVGVMLKLSPGMTTLVLAVMPFVVLVTVQFRRSVQQSYRRIRVAIARINSYLQEHVNGITVLQLFNREEKSRAEFDRINRDHMEAFKDAITAYGWFYPWVEFLGMLALAMLLAYGGFRIRGGALTLGVLVAFFQYGLRFFRPIQDLSDKYNILQSAMAASERIFKLMDTPVRIESPARPQGFPADSAAVEFDHVWFAYKDQDWVLSDVSVRIAPGETVAVVGHTGAGKTTLASLLEAQPIPDLHLCFRCGHRQFRARPRDVGPGERTNRKRPAALTVQGSLHVPPRLDCAAPRDYVQDQALPGRLRLTGPASSHLESTPAKLCHHNRETGAGDAHRGQARRAQAST